MSEWLSGSFWVLTPLSACNIKWRKPNCSLTSWRPPKFWARHAGARNDPLSLTDCSQLSDLNRISYEGVYQTSSAGPASSSPALWLPVFTAWLVNFHQFGGVAIAIIESCVCHLAGPNAFPLTDCSGRRKLSHRNCDFSAYSKCEGCSILRFFPPGVRSDPQKTPLNLCCVATAKTHSRAVQLKSTKHS